MEINRKTIVRDTDPILRSRSAKVALPLSEEDRTLLTAMHQYVKDSQDDEIAQEKDLQSSIGIAAIQVGVPKRMIAVVVGDDEYALANPRIVSRSVKKAYLADGEGCLSVKDEHPGYAYRNARVVVEGYDLLQDKPVRIEADDLLAICLQHEIDHLSGKLFYDRIDPKNPFYEDPDAIVL